MSASAVSNWFEEATQSLYASWLLLIRDTDGYRHFDQSEAGFWRSFSAIIIVAPLYLYASTVYVEMPGEAAPPAPSVVAALAGLVLQWVGWPLAMVFIARFAGLSQAYARYIIAYNWSSVLVVAALVPPLILLDLGLVGPGFAVLLSFILTIVSLYYRWYVAVTALGTTGLVAAALVLADVVLSLAVNRLVS
ncbi:MAG: hypothetical protein ACOC71_06180 [Hyphomicrobiales bacterium]